jgi:putative flavoprotein involved in K+ transport
MGAWDQPVEIVPSEDRGAFGVITGVHGGYDIDVRRFPANGVALLGHLRGVEGEKLAFACDVEQTLTQADEWCQRLLRSVDDYIEEAGLIAPEPDAPPPGPAVPSTPATLDLRAAGITSVVWATGFRYDYGWVHLPVFDDGGEPVHRRGVTRHPGVYFLGLNYLHTRRSGFVLGVGGDAAYLAEHIIARR